MTTRFERRARFVLHGPTQKRNTTKGGLQDTLLSARQCAVHSLLLLHCTASSRFKRRCCFVLGISYTKNKIFT